MVRRFPETWGDFGVEDVTVEVSSSLACSSMSSDDDTERDDVVEATDSS
jgi:hypothetical protein